MWSCHQLWPNHRRLHHDAVKRQQKLLPIKLDSVTELRRSLDSDHGSLSPVESSLFMSISSRPSLILVTETFHFSFIHGFSCESGWTKAETQHQQPRPPPQSGRTIRPLETTLIHYLTSSSLHPMIQFYSRFFSHHCVIPEYQDQQWFYNHRHTSEETPKTHKHFIFCRRPTPPWFSHAAYSEAK